MPVIHKDQLALFVADEDARSTVSYPAGTSHKFMTAAERAEYGIGDGQVRLSIGLEYPAGLQSDLIKGLTAIGYQEQSRRGERFATIAF